MPVALADHPDVIQHQAPERRIDVTHHYLFEAPKSVPGLSHDVGNSPQNAVY
jgi:hypothetical protein